MSVSKLRQNLKVESAQKNLRKDGFGMFTFGFFDSMGVSTIFHVEIDTFSCIELRWQDSKCWCVSHILFRTFPMRSSLLNKYPNLLRIPFGGRKKWVPINYR